MLKALLNSILNLFTNLISRISTLPESQSKDTDNLPLNIMFSHQLHLIIIHLVTLVQSSIPRIKTEISCWVIDSRVILLWMQDGPDCIFFEDYYLPDVTA